MDILDLLLLPLCSAPRGHHFRRTPEKHLMVDSPGGDSEGCPPLLKSAGFSALKAKNFSSQRSVKIARKTFAKVSRLFWLKSEWPTFEFESPMWGIPSEIAEVATTMYWNGSVQL